MLSVENSDQSKSCLHQPVASSQSSKVLITELASVVDAPRHRRSPDESSPHVSDGKACAPCRQRSSKDEPRRSVLFNHTKYSVVCKAEMLAILEAPQPGRKASPADGAPAAADTAEQVGEARSVAHRGTKDWAATRPKKSAPSW
eukprot:8555814-Pyramimonas_sp.AAC.2